ncbi:hypothetical protein Pmani_008914 [Petrolisthes manimaculis]|uniref:Uncharacterized protein n=1 Tax=Petrolisthes manimaculis TaxID=1843537 RepID=A0AAE1UDG5_9EUCA|nr:hypothetical protein Pmani_008914 [Petrolisthes manimaculis]
MGWGGGYGGHFREAVRLTTILASHAFTHNTQVMRRVINTATLKLALVMTAAMVFFLLQNYNPYTTTAVISSINTASSANVITHSNSTPTLPSQSLTKDVNIPVPSDGMKALNTKGSKINPHNDEYIYMPTRKNDSLSAFHRTTSSSDDNYRIQLMNDDGKDSLMDASISSLKIFLSKGKLFFADMISGSDKSNNEKLGNVIQTIPQATTKETKKNDFIKHPQYEINSWSKNIAEMGSQSNQAKINTNNVLHKSASKYEHKPKVNPSTKLEMCQVQMQVEGCECERTIISWLPKCPGPDVTQQQLLTSIKTTLGESTCSDSATLRGTNQSVVSYSLFGKFPSDYFRGAVKLANELPKSYPGWSIRFYHDLNPNVSRHKAWLCDLACQHSHLDLCNVVKLTGGLGDIRWSVASVWRMGVVGDPLVGRYLNRDADSPILQREVDAVDDWLRSGKLLLWPLMKKSLVSHDSYLCSDYPSIRPFPTRRQNFTFVGMRTYRGKYVNDQIPEDKPCPVRCRPKEHHDWIYC